MVVRSPSQLRKISIGIILPLAICIQIAVGMSLPSDDDVKTYFLRHQTRLEKIVKIIKAYPLISNVQQDIGKYDYQTQFGNLTPSYISVIEDIRRRIKVLNVQSISIARDGSRKDFPLISVNFALYSHGTVIHRESKSIVFFAEDAIIPPNKVNYEVISLSHSGWFMMHIKN